MKKIVTGCLVLLLILFANNAEARNGMNATRETPLSAADSAQLKRFRDSAFSSALFSARRQAYLDSALMIAPKYAWLWQQKSMPLFKQKKYELGAPFLDSAVKYDAGSWLDYRAFMKCIFQKSYREALTDFYAARALNGNIGVMDHPYDFYIALCHLQLNHFDSARYLLQRLIGAQMQHLGAAWVHPMNWFYLGIANNGNWRLPDGRLLLYSLPEAVSQFCRRQVLPRALSLSNAGMEACPGAAFRSARR